MVVLLWLIISAYFFCQHFYTIRTIDINRKVPTDNGTIWLEEIMLTNYEKDYSPLKDRPWYHDVDRNLQLRLSSTFMKICYFYSTPYEVNDDFGKIEVKGFLVLESSELRKEEIFHQLDVDVVDRYNAALTSGRRFHGSSNGNTFYFSSHGDAFPLGIEILRVNVENKDDEKIWELTFDQNQWKSHTYNDFFTPKPLREVLNTEQKLAKIYYTLREGSQEEIEGRILPEAEDQFSWDKLSHQYWDSPWGSYLNYEGEYQEYRDVFSYNITFRIPNDGSLDATQKVYLVYRYGAWKIIDVGPVEEVES